MGVMASGSDRGGIDLEREGFFEEALRRLEILPHLHFELRECQLLSDFIRTRIYDKYSGLIKTGSY